MRSPAKNAPQSINSVAGGKSSSQLGSRGSPLRRMMVTANASGTTEADVHVLATNGSNIDAVGSAFNAIITGAFAPTAVAGGAVGALINFVVAIIVSKVTAAPPEHIQHLVEDIRVPKGAGAASGH